jgi:mannose-6-phosphate isomerase-like protein (cupin superfamily)
MGPQNASRRPYEVERSARHVERPGFRITELQIGPSQQIPWHYHTHVQDTFFVLHGKICVSLRDPDEQVQLARGETHTVPARRPHLVRNAGGESAIFLVLQGFGEYDFVPVP